jgi:DNA-binding Xre family transcriptional regulator
MTDRKGITTFTAPTMRAGHIVSHLKELLAANGLSIPQLRERIGIPYNRTLYELANSTAGEYDFDILARVCAIFDNLPLGMLLEFVPEGQQASAHFQQRTVLQVLPPSYGGIRCLLMERKQEFTSAKQQVAATQEQQRKKHQSRRPKKVRFTWEEMVEDTERNKDTVVNLAYHRVGAVRARTLFELASLLGGVDRVFTYDPDFTHPASGLGMRKRRRSVEPKEAASEAEASVTES